MFDKMNKKWVAAPHQQLMSISMSSAVIVHQTEFTALSFAWFTPGHTLFPHIVEIAEFLVLGVTTTAFAAFVGCVYVNVGFRHQQRQVVHFVKRRFWEGECVFIIPTHPSQVFLQGTTTSLYLLRVMRPLASLYGFRFSNMAPSKQSNQKCCDNHGHPWLAKQHGSSAW